MAQGEATKQQNMTASQMRLDLEQDLAGLKAKRNAIGTEDIVSKNMMDKEKNELIRSLFKMMQDAGVDPSDLEAISSFLQNLEQQNPDLAELFKTAFEGLTGQSAMVGSAPEQVPGAPMTAPPTETPVGDNRGMMSKYSNITDQVMRQ